MTLAFGLACLHAAAADRRPDVPISSFAHTLWTQRDGVPAKVFAMAQTEDGWLWVGGPNGLHRFDGVQFHDVRFQATDSTRALSVSTLYATPSGALVIGLIGGGISIYAQKRFTHFHDDATVAAGRVQQIIRDLDGTLWAGCDNGVLRFDGQRWAPIGEDWNYRGTRSSVLMMDRQGVLWSVSTTKTDLLWRLPRGSNRFIPVHVPAVEPFQFVRSADGMIWMMSEDSALLLPDQTPGPMDRTELSRSADESLSDSAGLFWSYLPVQKGFPYPRVLDPDVSRHLTTILEDRQRNVWIASVDGELHRYRRPLLTKVPVPGISGGIGPRDGVAPAAIIPQADGRVWMALKWPRSTPIFGPEGVWVFDTALRRVQGESLKSGGSIAADPDGAIWHAVDESVWRLDRDRFERVMSLPASWTKEPVTGLAVGCAGGLWVASASEGLWRHDGMQWRRRGGIAALPDGTPTRLVCDARRRLWLGFGSGQLWRIDGSDVRQMGRADGLDLGRITDISIGRNVVISGELGLALLVSDRFVRVVPAHPSAFVGLTGVAQAPDGDLWVSATGAIGHVRYGDLPTATGEVSAQVPVDLYDVNDGYPGPGFTLPQHAPSIAIDASGRVWTAGVTGVAYLETTASRQRMATSALIQTVRSDGAVHEALGALALPKGTSNLRFDFTALNYAYPERLRFRYRLEGIDKDWVDDDGRRQASYANMGPGTFRFLVAASDDAGAWVTAPAVTSITIAPTFVQSWYFMVACLLAILAAAAMAHRLRLLQVARQQRRLLDERLFERERIARELHDTLLQGTQALILKIHALGNGLPLGGPLRHQLDDALQVAQRAMDEGRDRIQALRLQPDRIDDVGTRLMSVATDVDPHRSVGFSADIQGEPCALAAEVAEATYFVGREALTNAYRHAHASHIELQLVCGPDGLRLMVRDDGRGYDDSTPTTKTSTRHWGLAGMRERADGVGATLTVWTRHGAGTEVELSVPAAYAYPQEATGRWGWVRRLPVFASR